MIMVGIQDMVVISVMNESIDDTTESHNKVFLHNMIKHIAYFNSLADMAVILNLQFPSWLYME